jgi:hypothetical protein
VAQRLRSDHAGGGTGFQNADAFAARGLELEQAAGGLHDEERAVEPLAGDALTDIGEIALHARTDKSIGDHCRAALELAIFLRQFVRRGNEDAGKAPLQNLLGAQFVRRIAVAVQEQNRDRFDLLALESVGQRKKLGLVERLGDAAVGIKALRHFVAMPPRHQREMLLEEQIIGVGPIDAADLVDVAKAARRDQRGLGAGALQHGVDGDRGAVQEQAGIGKSGARLGDAIGDALDHRRRRRQALAEKKPLIGWIERRNVGEGAADIGGKAQTGATGWLRETPHVAKSS